MRRRIALSVAIFLTDPFVARGSILGARRRLLSSAPFCAGRLHRRLDRNAESADSLAAGPRAGLTCRGLLRVAHLLTLRGE